MFPLSFLLQHKRTRQNCKYSIGFMLTAAKLITNHIWSTCNTGVKIKLRHVRVQALKTHLVFLCTNVKNSTEVLQHKSCLKTKEHCFLFSVTFNTVLRLFMDWCRVIDVGWASVSRKNPITL